MWDNFIGQQIRRCNRNFLIANIVFVGAIIGYASQFNYRSEGFGLLFLSIPLFICGRMELRQVEQTNQRL